LNITPEKDLTHRRCHCRCFLCKESFVTIATIANDVSSQQWQWLGQATAVEIEAAAGAHNNQLTNGSNMAAEIEYVAASATMVVAYQHNPIHTQKRHSPRLQERRHIWIIRVQRTTGEKGKEQDRIHSGRRPHKLSGCSSHPNSRHARCQTPV
jgi:hypothetical protein